MHFSRLGYYRMSGQTVVLLCIILCHFGLVKSDTEADGYSGEVKALFKTLTAYTSNVNTAKAKMKEFDGKTWDKKYAIAIINLYTQGGSFYLTLNSEMRNHYPDNATNIWKQAGDLINRGLDILGQTVYKKLFRGCGKLSVDPLVGKDFLFNQITSTSSLRSTAYAFSPCNGTLFHISNVYGVSVADYSYFKFEAEVILKSCNIFKVEKGPIKENGRNVYYLDGQTDFNRIHKECKWTEISTDRTSIEMTPNSTDVTVNDSEPTGADNGTYRTGEKTCVAAVILILVLRQMLFDGN